MNSNLKKLIARLVESKTEAVKLGMDVHARDVVVGLKADGAPVQRPVRLPAEQVVALAQGLVQAGLKVFSCYEAGPCGYGLHRALTAVGTVNFVVAAELLGDGRRQKTDSLDARALAERLDSYQRGHRKAFQPVTVPSELEQERRSEARLREQLKQSRKQWEARGRSLLLFYGHHVTGAWWKARRWAELQERLAPFLVRELTVMRKILRELDAQEQARQAALVAEAPKQLPKAVGALTWVLLAREVCTWTRFKNRRQVSSYTGLCPGIYQTGTRRRDGSINRHGNPRVRALLIELVWRLVRWQPDYPPIRALVGGLAQGAARRKCAVAAARKLAVDLWRLATGQTTPEKLHLTVLPV